MLSAIIVAAGSSTRAGFDKLFAKIGGCPVIQYSLAAFERAGCVDEIVVICREETPIWEIIEAANFTKVRAVVRGGARRQDSVQAGLNELPRNAEFVAVHDAARPLITPREVERVFSAAREQGAAALAAPVADTLKIADAAGCVIGSIDRKNVFAMQTPQIFRRALLVEAYDHVRRNSLTITDEVSAIEHAGGKIVIVPSEDHNLKITFASDLPLAEFILDTRSS